jgi:hypothetical protein
LPGGQPKPAGSSIIRPAGRANRPPANESETALAVSWPDDLDIDGRRLFFQAAMDIELMSED